MARYLILAAALLGAALADDASYAAPSNNYAAPASSYGAPSYSAPASDYSASSYEQPSYDGYAEPATGYGVTASEEGDFKLDKIFELIPFFLAVLAAIIIAQLIAPLISMLLGAKAGLISTGLAPIVPAKIGLINAVLAPFSLALCDTSTNPISIATGRSAREFAEEYSLSPELVEGVAKFASSLYETYITGETA